MKIARLAGLALLASMAMGLVLVSAASATEPLFNPIGATILGDSQLPTLRANNGAEVVHCQESHTFGKILNTLLIGNVVIHYLNCTSSGSKGSNCAVNSIGAEKGSGLILTNTLHGILGLILPSKETGLLFLPVLGKTFVELEENGCTIETAVSGSVAGLVEPLNTKTIKGWVLFEREPGPGNNQAILDIDLTHGLGLVAPRLTAFSTTATQTQLELITFSAETEVT
jgi:hypothetical protein